MLYSALSHDVPRWKENNSVIFALKVEQLRSCDEGGRSKWKINANYRVYREIRSIILFLYVKSWSLAMILTNWSRVSRFSSRKLTVIYYGLTNTIRQCNDMRCEISDGVQYPGIHGDIIKLHEVIYVYLYFVAGSSIFREYEPLKRWK